MIILLPPLLLLLTAATSASSFLRVPTPTDLLPFLKASPLHPRFAPPILPPAFSNARVDHGVGLPAPKLKANEACSENRTLGVWDFGVITSPKYPDDYPPSRVCEWILTAPEGTRIEATIFDMTIQPWFLHHFDAVSISESGDFSTVDNYAGDQNAKTPFTLNSTGNSFAIRFKSDALINYRGFKLHYVVLPIASDPATPFEANDDGVCGRADPSVFEVSTTPAPAPTAEPAPDAETTTTTSPAASETNGTKIIGDSPAHAHALPWMVAMLIDGKHFCGGSVIDDTHIVTAAHCTNEAEQITILLGAHNIRANSSEEPGRLVINVTKSEIFTHPQYNEDRVFNDISIIRLPTPLTFSPSIRPICLPNRKYLAETFLGREVQVSGWGLTADGGKISPTLQHTNVTVMSNADCKTIFRDLVTGNLICVKTTPKHSPCRGDSGGPLMLKEGDSSSSSHWTQIGIVSFGSYSCERGFPVAFTRITAFLDYISTVTGRKL